MFLWCNKLTQKIVFVTKGSGEKKRSGNIKTIRKLIEQGLDYQQIWCHACFYLSMRTFNEYYQIAYDSVKREKENEQKQQ